MRNRLKVTFAIVVAQCVFAANARASDRNVCSPCHAGQIVSASGLCTSCAPNDIVVNNTCTPCAFDQGPDGFRTTCLACPVDVTLDWVVVPNTCAHSATLLAGANPGDICPDRFIVNVTNLDDIFNHDPDAAGAMIDVFSSVTSAGECAATLSHVDFGDLSASGLSVVATSDWMGQWIEIPGGCTHQEGVQFISADEIDMGTTSRALMFKISNGVANYPGSVVISGEGNPAGCAPK